MHDPNAGAPGTEPTPPVDDLGAVQPAPPTEAAKADEPASGVDVVGVLQRGLLAAHASPAQSPELRAFIREGEAVLAAIGADPVRTTTEPDVPELPPHATDPDRKSDFA